MWKESLGLAEGCRLVSQRLGGLEREELGGPWRACSDRALLGRSSVPNPSHRPPPPGLFHMGVTGQVEVQLPGQKRLALAPPGEGVSHRQLWAAVPGNCSGSNRGQGQQHCGRVCPRLS